MAIALDKRSSSGADADRGRHFVFLPLLVAALGGLCWVGPLAATEDASVMRGHALLETNCARCHAIGKTGESPFSPAPPFRILHDRYPVEDLEEALAEGIVSGHPAMPEFVFAPDEITDIVNYLKSLHP